jgi:hypothetical protein
MLVSVQAVGSRPAQRGTRSSQACRAKKNRIRNIPGQGRGGYFQRYGDRDGDDDEDTPGEPESCFS